MDAKWKGTVKDASKRKGEKNWNCGMLLIRYEHPNEKQSKRNKKKSESGMLRDKREYSKW